MQRVHVGIDAEIDHVPAAAVVQHAGPGERHLCHTAGVCRQEAKVLDHRMAGKADLADDAQRLVDADAALEVHAGVELDRRDALKMFQKIEVPVSPAELAVGDRLQADRLLLADEGHDLAVLDRFERGVGDLRTFALLTGELQRWRPQQAADHVGAERRLMRHGVVSSGKLPQAV